MLQTPARSAFRDGATRLARRESAALRNLASANVNFLSRRFCNAPVVVPAASGAAAGAHGPVLFPQPREPGSREREAFVRKTSGAGLRRHPHLGERMRRQPARVRPWGRGLRGDPDHRPFALPHRAPNVRQPRRGQELRQHVQGSGRSNTSASTLPARLWRSGPRR